MPNEKLKSENYQNLGGINTKVSPYLDGPTEFLDLINMDFQTPGALTHRWGSTMYVGQTFPGPVNSSTEFSYLNGSSFVFIGFSGGLFYGATTGNSQGMSLAGIGSTFQSYFYPILITNFILSGPNIGRPISKGTQVNYLGQNGIVSDSTSAGPSLQSSVYVSPQSFGSNYNSYAGMNNQLFIADGNKFVRFDGATTYQIGVPPPLKAFGASYANSSSLVGADIGVSLFTSTVGSSELVGFATGTSFSYILYCSYVNNRGFEGPIWPLFVSNYSFENGSSASAFGGSWLILKFALNTPLQYGISAVNLYSYATASLISNPGNDSNLWSNDPYVLMSQVPASGSTITWISAGSTAGGQSMMNSNIGPLPNSIFQSYFPLGLTAVVSGNSNFVGSIDQYDWLSFAPQMLDVYQNRLMSAGFSLSPSTVWFSDISEPEGYAADFNFEVRTNDGDYITAIKSFQTNFYIFKQNSFHILQGDNPNNFFLQQVTDQYGCVNNRSVVAYDNFIAFLDRKGVMVWDGANIRPLSKDGTPKIQPIFDTMNYSAALTSACAVHDKLRNQLLFAIPINGSTTNNITLVYDYLVGAWTKYDGFTPSSFAAIRGRNNTKNAFYGDTSGRLNWFGPSFLADNGVGFSGYIKSRFLHDLGDSSQKMFRRLYLNVDAPLSGTLAFNINFFQDYGSSIVKSITMALGQFQNRADFGVSAKSLAFELSNLQSAIPLKIHGFTVESRFLRRV